MRGAPPAKFRTAEDGVAALEFALILPFALLLILGGYNVSEYIMISRKVSLSARTVGDLTSKYSTLYSSDVASILNAPLYIVAPFDPAMMAARLSGVSTDATGKVTTVAWSRGVNEGGYVQGTAFSISQDLQLPSAFYVVAEVSYTYTPKVRFGIAGPFVITFKIVLPPRKSGSIRMVTS